MNVEEFREYCLSKKAVTEEFPFDDTTLVFKVSNRMFALTGLDTAFRFTVKTEPGEGIALRERYSCIRPAWHMNKTHWIRVISDQTISDRTMKKIIDRSYELVVNKLTGKEKRAIK